MSKDLDLVSKLTEAEETRLRNRLKSISPDDGKYGETSEELVDYLSAEAEWKTCAYVQSIILDTMVSFGKAKQKNLDKMIIALEKIDPLNMYLLEKDRTLKILHDQLSVIEEIGRYVSLDTKALLHPGITSYDILDTVRAYLFRRAWNEVIKPKISESIERLCDLALKYIKTDGDSLKKDGKMIFLQVGRTHLQNTSPVPWGATLAGYALRLAKRLEKCDSYFGDLKGKISGIVGTGAGIEMVIGRGNALEFEKKTLGKLGLEPDTTATQVTQKESLADVGHGLTSLMLVLKDFANDVRILYSSAIGELTSRSNEERLGGSSADALKNNPINYENIIGKAKIVESGMTILYDMITTDLQRDLSSSVEARYQPQAMMDQTYEAFERLYKILPQLSVNEDKMATNLVPVRENPSEAMGSILKGEKFIHSEYGLAHDFVKEIGKKAKVGGRKLLDAASKDDEFRKTYDNLPKYKKDILNGKLEKYIGFSLKRATENVVDAMNIINK